MKNIIAIIKTKKIVISGIIILCVAFITLSIGLFLHVEVVPPMSGNISNYGYVLVDDDDIYYTKIIETPLMYYSNIYKYNISTRTETLVAVTETYYPNEMNSFLTMYNGELYFLANYQSDLTKKSSPNIYKVTPDGRITEPVKLLEENISCAFMQISDGMIYYYDDYEQAIYKTDINGTQKEFLCGAVISGMAVGNGKIYYAEYGRIMQISTKGGEPSEVCDFSDDRFYIESIVLEGDHIYYSDDSYFFIGRVRTDGNRNQIIYKANEAKNEYIDSFNVNGGVVYIVSENYSKDSMYSVLLVTPGIRIIKQIISSKNEFGYIAPLAIWDDTIYFLGMQLYEVVLDSDYVWFTVKKSGGRLSPFQPLAEYSAAAE